MNLRDRRIEILHPSPSIFLCLVDLMKRACVRSLEQQHLLGFLGKRKIDTIDVHYCGEHTIFSREPTFEWAGPNGMTNRAVPVSATCRALGLQPRSRLLAPSARCGPGEPRQATSRLFNFFF